MEHMPRMLNDGTPITSPLAPARFSQLERPDRGEPPFGTTWAYLDSQDEQDAYIEPTEDHKAAEYEAERAAEYAAFTDGDVSDDERSIELDDYRGGLYPSWVRPGYVDWKHEAE